MGNNKKITEITCRKDAMIFLNQLIKLTEKRMRRMKRYICEIDEVVKQHKLLPSDSRHVKSEIYEDLHGKIENAGIKALQAILQVCGCCATCMKY